VQLSTSNDKRGKFQKIQLFGQRDRDCDKNSEIHLLKQTKQTLKKKKKKKNTIGGFSTNQSNPSLVER